MEKLKQLHELLVSQKIDNKSFEEFSSNFSGNPEKQKKLHDLLVQKKIDSKPFEEFQANFFAEEPVQVKKKESASALPSQDLGQSRVSGEQQGTVSAPTTKAPTQPQQPVAKGPVQQTPITGTIGLPEFVTETPAEKPLQPGQGVLAQPKQQPTKQPQKFGEEFAKQYGQQSTVTILQDYLRGILRDNVATEADVDVYMNELPAEKMPALVNQLEIIRKRKDISDSEKKLEAKKTIQSALSGQFLIGEYLANDIAKYEDELEKLNPQEYQRILAKKANDSFVASGLGDKNEYDARIMYSAINQGLGFGKDLDPEAQEEAKLLVQRSLIADKNLDYYKSNPSIYESMLAKRDMSLANIDSQIKVLRENRLSQYEDKIDSLNNEIAANPSNTEAIKQRDELIKNRDKYLDPAKEESKVIGMYKSEVMQQAGATPREKLKNYYISLEHERRDLEKRMPQGAFAQTYQATIGGTAPVTERYNKVVQRMNSIAPIVFFNQKPYEQGIAESTVRQFYDMWGGKRLSNIKASDAQVAGDILESLTYAGIDPGDISKEAVAKLRTETEGYGLSDPRFYSNMFGMLGGVGLQGMAGGVVGKAFQAPKWIATGPKMLKTIYNMAKAGSTYEITGNIFKDSADEFDFVSGVAGGAAEGLFKLGGNVSGKLLKNLGLTFGENTPKAVAVIKKHGQNFLAGAAGETGEETLQDLWHVYRDTGSFKQFLDEHDTWSENLKYFIGISLMGGTMGMSTGLGKEAEKEAANAFNELTPEEQETAREYIGASLGSIQDRMEEVESKQGQVEEAQPVVTPAVEEAAPVTAAEEVAPVAEPVAPVVEAAPVVTPEAQGELDALTQRADEITAILREDNATKQATGKGQLTRTERDKLINEVSDINRQIQEAQRTQAPVTPPVTPAVQMAPTAPIEVKPISAEELDFEGDLVSQLEQQTTPQEVQRDQEDIQRLPSEERIGQEPVQAEPIEGAGREAVAPGGMVQEQGQEVAPVARTEAGSKRAYDFDDTLYDPKTKKLTPLGEEVKARIAAGEDVTIVTARNSRQTGDITKALGISKGKIQATGSEAKKGEVLDKLGIDRNDYYDADQAKMQAIQTKAEPVAEVETIVEEPAVTPEVKAPVAKPTAEAPAVATMQPVTAEQKAAVITGDEISFNYKSPIGGEPIQYTGKVVSEGKDATTGLRKLFVETEVEGTVERLPVFERDIVAKKTAEPAVEAAAPKAAKPTDRKKASSKGIRFEKGKKLTEEEKKEVYRTITDSYKELDRPWELETRFSESSGRDYEARVWIGEPKDYMVKSDVTGRLLRYYIIMPDGTIAHPTEVFPNVSSSEMKIVQDNIESHDAEASRKMDNMVSQLDKSGETDKVVKAIDKAIENGAVFEKQYDGNDKGKRDADVRLRFPNGRSQSIAEYVIRTTGSLLGITESELAAHRTGEKVNPILNRQPDWEQFHANQKAAAPKAEEAKPKTSPKKTANRIRQAKIDTKGKAFDATIGLPIALWNQAIEMVALAVEGGMALADAIKKGIDFINKQQAGKKWNEDEFRKKVQGLEVSQVATEEAGDVSPLRKEKVSIDKVKSDLLDSMVKISGMKMADAENVLQIMMATGQSMVDMGVYPDVQAYLEAMDFRDTKGGSASADALQQIVGENAQLSQTIITNLNVAKDMEIEGKSEKEIKLATGWERGADAKWRYEVQDYITGVSDAFELIGKGQDTIQVPASTLVSKELNVAYPQLANVMVTIAIGPIKYIEYAKGHYATGVYMPGKNNKLVDAKIKVAAGSIKQAQSTLLHEVQHAIQQIEGFEKGANVAMFEVDTTNHYREELVQLLEGFNNIDTAVLQLIKLNNLSQKQLELLGFDNRDSSGNIVPTTTVRYYSPASGSVVTIKDATLEHLLDVQKGHTKRWKWYIDELTEKSNKKDVENAKEITQKLKGATSAYDAYKRVAGEVEARNVQKRMEMTPEQRRKSMLQETEDVARDHQIVLVSPFMYKSADRKTWSLIDKATDFIKKFESEQTEQAISNLTKEYQKWISDNELPLLSADEIVEHLLDKIGQSSSSLQQASNAQFRIENDQRVVEILKDLSEGEAVAAALHEAVFHGAMTDITTAASNGNSKAKAHLDTIVNEYNKANSTNLTADEVIAGNEAFKSGKGVSDNYRDVQEFFARAGERYLTEGPTGFSKAMQEILDAVKEVFQQVYKSIKNSAIDVPLTPELEAVFEDILGKNVTQQISGKVSPQSEVKAALDKMKNAWADWLGSGMGAMADPKEEARKLAAAIDATLNLGAELIKFGVTDLAEWSKRVKDLVKGTGSTWMDNLSDAAVERMFNASKKRAEEGVKPTQAPAKETETKKKVEPSKLSTTGKTRQRGVEITFLEHPEIAGETLDQMIKSQPNYYETIDLGEVLELARKEIEEQGFKALWPTLMKPGSTEPIVAAMRMMAIQAYSMTAAQARRAGDIEMSNKISQNLEDLLIVHGADMTKAGQFTSVMSQFGLMAPYLDSYLLSRAEIMAEKVLAKVDPKTGQTTKQKADNAAKDLNEAKKAKAQQIADAVVSTPEVEGAKIEKQPKILGMTKKDAQDKLKQALEEYNNIRVGGGLSAGGLQDAVAYAQKLKAAAKVGYYIVANGAFTFAEWTAAMKKNIPDLTDDELKDIWENEEIDGKILGEIAESELKGKKEKTIVDKAVSQVKLILGAGKGTVDQDTKEKIKDLAKAIKNVAKATIRGDMSNSDLVEELQKLGLNDSQIASIGKSLETMTDMAYARLMGESYSTTKTEAEILRQKAKSMLPKEVAPKTEAEKEMQKLAANERASVRQSISDYLRGNVTDLVTNLVDKGIEPKLASKIAELVESKKPSLLSLESKKLQAERDRAIAKQQKAVEVEANRILPKVTAPKTAAEKKAAKDRADMIESARKVVADYINGSFKGDLASELESRGIPSDVAKAMADKVNSDKATFELIERNKATAEAKKQADKIERELNAEADRLLPKITAPKTDAEKQAAKDRKEISDKVKTIIGYYVNGLIPGNLSDSLVSAGVPKDVADSIEAKVNADKGKFQAIEAAKEKAKQDKDAAQATAKQDAFINSIVPKAPIQKQKTPQVALRDKIRDAIANHLVNPDGRTLEQVLMDDLNLDADSAQKIVQATANKTADELGGVIKQKANSIVKKAAKELSKAQRAEVAEAKKSVTGRLVYSLVNGDLDGNQVAKEMAEYIGLPADLTPEQRQKLRDLAMAISEAKIGSKLRDKLEWDFAKEADAVLRHVGRNKRSFFQWLFNNRNANVYSALVYASMLNGIPTFLKNFVSVMPYVYKMVTLDVANIPAWMNAVKVANSYKGPLSKSQVLFLHSPVYQQLLRYKYGRRSFRLAKKEAAEALKTGRGFYNWDESIKQNKNAIDKIVESVPILERTNFIGGKWNPFNHIFGKMAGRVLAATDMLTSTYYENQEIPFAMLSEGIKAGMTKAEVTKKMNDFLSGASPEWQNALDQAREQAANAEAFGFKVSESTIQAEAARMMRENMKSAFGITQKQGQEMKTVARDKIYSYKRHGIFGTLADILSGSRIQGTAGTAINLLTKPIVPFTNIVGNMADAFIDTLPGLGFASANIPGSMMAESRSVDDKVYRHQMARATYGTLALAALMMMAGDDEEDFLYFSGPDKDPAKAYKVYIGGKPLYDYRMRPELYLPIRIVQSYKDYYKNPANKDASFGEALGLSYLNALASIKDMSFLDGIADFVEVVGRAAKSFEEAGASGENFEKFGKVLFEGLARPYIQFALKPLPTNQGIIRNIDKMIDPALENKQDFKESVAYYLGLQSYYNEKRVDIFGNVIKNMPGDDIIPLSQWLGLKEADKNNFKILQENKVNMDAPSNPIRTFEEENSESGAPYTQRKMTPKEFFEYTVLAGKKFSEKIEDYKTGYRKKGKTYYYDDEKEELYVTTSGKKTTMASKRLEGFKGLARAEALKELFGKSVLNQKELDMLIEQGEYAD